MPMFAELRRPRLPKPAPFRAMSALHQIEENALAHAAIGDPQSADRPSRADCVENRAPAQNQVGALAADTGVGGAAGQIEAGEVTRDPGDLLESQGAAVNQRAGVARQR